MRDPVYRKEILEAIMLSDVKKLKELANNGTVFSAKCLFVAIGGEHQKVINFFHKQGLKLERDDWELCGDLSEGTLRHILDRFDGCVDEALINASMDNRPNNVAILLEYPDRITRQGLAEALLTAAERDHRDCCLKIKKHVRKQLQDEIADMQQQDEIADMQQQDELREKDKQESIPYNPPAPQPWD